MRRESGFTLVELLVTMTILGMTVGLLSSSLRLSVKTSDRLEMRLMQAESLQMAHRVIREQLGRAVPIPIIADDQIEDIEFSGSQSEIQFVTAMQNTGIAGGFYRATLRLERDGERDEDRYSLVASYVKRNSTADDATGAMRRVLVDQLTRAEISYLGRGRLRAAGWQDSWQGRGQLPALVRIRMANEEGGEFNLPDLVVAPQLSIVGWRETS